MTEQQFIKTSVEDRVGVLTIDHPPVNALNRATLSELAAAVDELIADAAVKVVVITGAGQVVFVAGADINEFTKIETAEQAQAFSRETHELFRRIELAPKPFIAAINGLALGGGLELAMACPLRVIGEGA